MLSELPVAAVVAVAVDRSFVGSLGQVDQQPEQDSDFLQELVLVNQ